jgi:predicted acylesterase/phospholipase RssA
VPLTDALPERVPVDLVLSSGFLAFAGHAGFLAAVEEGDIAVDGICGTSSGALLGALWASGMDARAILARLTARRPLAWARPHPAPWRGALSLGPVVAELASLLPPTFEDLGRPFGVGVRAPDGTHRLIRSGRLPEAVAASCAVPYLFAPIALDGEWLQDGGAVDRTALRAWRAHRPDADVVLHLIDRTAGADGEGIDGARVVVRSPRSGASLWSLGDTAAAFEASRRGALEVLRR